MFRKTTDAFDWASMSGGTPSFATGPSGDNTSGTGTYYYTESSGNYYNSAGLTKVDVSTLNSPALHSSTTCMVLEWEL